MVRRGIGVSPGIAVARAVVFEGRPLATSQHPVRAEDVPGELRRLEAAVGNAKRQIEEIRKNVQESLREELSQILDAHLLMLDDDAFVGAAARAIAERQINAEWALTQVVEGITRQFRSFEQEYFRERARDVEDVAERVLRSLSGIEGQGIRGDPGDGESSILVAHDPSPTETAQLDRRYVKGIALDAGGRTSHTGIIAKSLGIPAVVGLGTITGEVHNGDLLILDGNQGEVIIQPSVTLVREYKAKQQAHESHERELLKYRDLPAMTADGHKVFLQANIDFPGEIELAIRNGAEGIGLFRSEYLFLHAETKGLPSEEEQYQVYRTLAERLHPRSVIIRTIDFGGGKVAPFGEHAEENNPIMGLRAIRYCLKHRDVFKVQLRALLRASVHGRLKIMFPMITSVTELRLAKVVLEEAREELRQEGTAFNEDLALGIMIEVPAAAAIADLLAREVSFFSIGTNDLIQFFLAIDRDNPAVTYLYEPIHPGVLRTIRQIVEAAHKNGIRVGMCGEMASEPLYILLLIGLGLDELSMNSVSIPLAKKIIRAIDREVAKRMVEKALQLATAQEVEEYALENLVSRFPHGYL